MTAATRGPASDHASGASGGVAIVALRDGEPFETTSLDDLPPLLADPGATVWIDLTYPSAAEVSAVARAVGLHPLIVEDIVESNERAKIEHFGDVMHLVLFGLSGDREVRPDELDFVLGPGFLLSVHSPTREPRGRASR